MKEKIDRLCAMCSSRCPGSFGSRLVRCDVVQISIFCCSHDI